MKRKISTNQSDPTKKPRLDGVNQTVNIYKSEVELGDFPTEVLEIVFSQLPLLDLLRTCCVVCSKWKDIINSNQFLYWRKIYFRFKLGADLAPENDPNVIFNYAKDSFSASAWNEKFASSQEEDDTNWNIGLPWLLEYVHNRYKNKNSSFACVAKHSKYSSFHPLMSSRWPHLGNAAMAVLLAVSGEHVWDVRELIKVLLSPRSLATGREVTELLYLTATFLLMFQRKEMAPGRLHYQVFHALYYYENDWAFKPTSASSAPKPVKSGQRSLLSLGFTKVVPKMPLTAEQQRIVCHPVQKNSQDIVKIVAFAGTGKTTTLVHLAEAHPELKFLLVVYNKSVKLLAETMFPKGNVMCKTVHQMAMAKCGWMFNKKLTGNLKARDIIESGIIPEKCDSDTSYHQRAGQVLETITNFMNSSDYELTEEHVPSVWKTGHSEKVIGARDRGQVLCGSLDVWKAISDKEDARIRIPHDGYVKLWQMWKPDLQRVTPHDILLLDEGQDMNPSMLEIFLRQNIPRFIVGDPNQQIYTFRGAINALDTIPATHTFFLTQSFRFGPEIAYVANVCLEYLKNKDQRTLVGGKKEDDISGTNITKNKGLAIIGRTNMAVFDALVDTLSAQTKNSRLTMALAGGVANYSFDVYLDIYYLYSNQKEKMKKYKNFKSYVQFKKFAEDVNDVELMSKIKIVEKYKQRLPSLIQKIESRASCDIRRADIVFSTAHKSKGLEFDTVNLLDDFLGNYNFSTGRFDDSGNHEDELNLLYVAATRAKNRLILNSALYQLLSERAKDNFDRLVVIEKELMVCCTKCGKLISGVTLERMEIIFQTTGNLVGNKGGIIDCDECIIRVSPDDVNNKKKVYHYFFSSLLCQVKDPASKKKYKF